MLGENPGADASRKDNTVGKRVKDATAAYKEAKKTGRGVTEATNKLSDSMDKLLVEAANRATWDQRQTRSRKAGRSPSMAKLTVALKFLRRSKEWQLPFLRGQLSELTPELQDELPSPWDSRRAAGDPRGAREAWPTDSQEAEKRIRRGLSEASKRHQRTCINNNTAAREHARRLGKTGRIFRELLGSRRANGKEILTPGEGESKEHLYTADTVHRAFSGHFDRHFGAGRKKQIGTVYMPPFFSPTFFSPRD